MDYRAHRRSHDWVGSGGNRMTTRVRFGVRLGWPIQNAATFIVYMSPARYDTMERAFSTIRTVLVGAGREDIAKRLICEASEA